MGKKKRATNVLQQKAMLRVLPPIIKPVNNLICCKTGFMWVV